MEHKPLEEIRSAATVISATPLLQDRRELRRARLERLATVLERHEEPLSLFSRVEYLDTAARSLLRTDGSPLTIAYRDPVLRAQGLASDRMGDGMAFFGLSARQAHSLLCDCHSVGPATGRSMAARVRAIARQRTLGEFWTSIRSVLRF
jgi:hypothetical protein